MIAPGPGDLEYYKFLESVDNDLGRDQDSLNLFEWVVEDHYEAKIKESRDYYMERPDLLELSKEQMIYQLDHMIRWFERKEDYEKCARILKIKETMFAPELISKKV
jgi:sucrose-6-phosphate hydrolase SacC (GH32 family)